MQQLLEGGVNSFEDNVAKYTDIDIFLLANPDFNAKRTGKFQGFSIECRDVKEFHLVHVNFAWV